MRAATNWVTLWLTVTEMDVRDRYRGNDKQYDDDDDNHLTEIYQNHPGEPTPEPSKTLTQYTTFTVLKFHTNTVDLPSQSTSRL